MATEDTKNLGLQLFVAADRRRDHTGLHEKGSSLTAVVDGETEDVIIPDCMKRG